MDLDEIKKNALIIDKFCKLDKFKKLKNENPKKYENQMKDIFNSFAVKYPDIFKLLINNCDINILLMMLEMKKKIDNNEIDQKKAEVFMGEQLAEKFIYLVVGKGNIDLKKKEKRY